MARLVLARGLPLQPGAARLLAALDAAGVPCALVTASYRAIMDAVLKVTGLSFGVTVCGEDVQRGKPDPEPYLRAAALLGCAAGRVRGAGGLAHRHRGGPRGGLPGDRGAQRAGIARARADYREIAATTWDLNC